MLDTHSTTASACWVLVSRTQNTRVRQLQMRCYRALLKSEIEAIVVCYDVEVVLMIIPKAGVIMGNTLHRCRSGGEACNEV
jgi:CMP-2-keto-3-deoxyoctulosonic acid synthetase